MTSLNLRQRLLLLGLLPSVMLAVILVAYFVFSGMRALEGELRERGVAVVRYLAPVSEYGIIAGHFESLQGLAQTTVQQPGVKAAVVVGRLGQILAVSGRVSLSSGQLKRAPAEPGMVADSEQWIAFGAPVIRSLAESDQLFDPGGAKAAPEVIGQIFVEFDKTELLERQKGLVQRGVLIVAIGLLFMAAIALGIADTVTRPVTRLVQAVRSMGLGRFDTRIEELSFGEIRELEQGFNDMADRIAQVHRTLQERIDGATAELAFQARHDPLTGLVNRLEFESRLEKTLAAVQAGGEESSLLFIDLDGFKTVNETCGYPAGDELLWQLSRIFRDRLREEDTLARIGGDEFGVLLANCVGSRALQVAEDLCSLTAAYRFIWQDKILDVGASIGLLPVNRQSKDVATLLSTADAACTLAKEKGGNRVHVQASGSAQGRIAGNGGRQRGYAALAGEQMACDAFPLRPFRSGSEPDHFVEIAPRGLPAAADSGADEPYGLTALIDQRVLQRATASLARVAACGRRMRCLVPLSPASLRRHQTIDAIAAALAKEGGPAGQLYLLISQENALQHPEQTRELCRRARALGCRIALGACDGGFAALSLLRDIRPDCVKVSPALVGSLDGDPCTQALLRSLQQASEELGMESIAAGVDDLATFNLLQELGITYAQGRAAAPSEPFDDWIEGAVIR